VASLVPKELKGIDKASLISSTLHDPLGASVENQEEGKVATGGDTGSKAYKPLVHSSDDHKETSGSNTQDAIDRLWEEHGKNFNRGADLEAMLSIGKAMDPFWRLKRSTIRDIYENIKNYKESPCPKLRKFSSLNKSSLNLFPCVAGVIRQVRPNLTKKRQWDNQYFQCALLRFTPWKEGAPGTNSTTSRIYEDKPDDEGKTFSILVELVPNILITAKALKASLLPYRYRLVEEWCKNTDFSKK